MKITLSHTKKHICDECGKQSDSYRKIHRFHTAHRNFNLCTECMLTLSVMIQKEFGSEFDIREETEEDIRLHETLRILFNRKINDDWDDNCEKELLALDVNKMLPSDKVLHRQIIEW